MENQLPTQQTSNLSETVIKKRNELTAKVKENLNYIYIVLMIIVNCILSLFTVKDGTIIVTHPTTAIGWVLWATQIFLSTLIGVLILHAFRRQGIHDGHKVIKDTYDKYLEVIRTHIQKAPRSLKEYMRGEARKDSIVKTFIFIIVSLFTGSIIIGATLNNLITLVVNIIFAIAFGIKAMVDAEEFVVNELIIWYQLKIAEVTDQKLEPAQGETNGVSKQRSKRISRPTKSGGVQQEKKRRTRPKTVNLIKPSSTTNRTSTSRLSS